MGCVYSDESYSIVATLSNYWDPAQQRVGLVVLEPFHIYIITQGVIRYTFISSYTKLIKAPGQYANIEAPRPTQAVSALLEHAGSHLTASTSD